MSSLAPVTGMLRLTRAAVLTLATVSLSLAAHVAAGGSAPGPVGLMLLVAPVLALSLSVTGRRLGLAAVGTVLALIQVGLHRAFMALGTGGATGAGLTTDHHGYLVRSALGPPGGFGPTPFDGSPLGGGLLDGALSGTSPAMAGAHVVAAGLVALLLARGEATLWSVWSWLRPVLPVAAQLVEWVEDCTTTGRPTLRSTRLVPHSWPRAPPAAAPHAADLPPRARRAA